MMMLYGYRESFRSSIIQSALAAWERMLVEDRTGVQPLHWERWFRRAERNKQKEKKISR